ncbi:MAG: threonine dehydratase [Polyangiaceae bacterium]
MDLPSRSQIEAAADIVHRAIPPTPQIVWPLLGHALGAEAWVKHENHVPVGAFKVRGGLVYFDRLLSREPACRGVISATRGNHGQSIGFSARAAEVPATIFVPLGNSREKNDAMRALGVSLVEHGRDFQEAREEAARVAKEQSLHFVPSFHFDLVAGVATAYHELFRAAPDLDVVLVPIGLGSGFAACVAAREALGCRARILGVVSAQAPCYALSRRAGKPVEAEVTTAIADGLACRVPDAEALDLLQRYAEDVLEVTDSEIAEAMRILFRTTHNVAEGAGAASLAGALQIKSRLAGKKVGVILTGGNVDSDVFARVLSGSGNFHGR